MAAGGMIVGAQYYRRLQVRNQRIKREDPKRARMGRRSIYIFAFQNLCSFLFWYFNLFSNEFSKFSFRHRQQLSKYKMHQLLFAYHQRQTKNKNWYSNIQLSYTNISEKICWIFEKIVKVITHGNLEWEWSEIEQENMDGKASKVNILSFQMGNCFGNPQQTMQQNRHQEWRRQPQLQQQQPRFPNQQPPPQFFNDPLRNQHKPPIMPHDLSEMEDSLEDAYDTTPKNKPAKKFQSKELNVNQMFLFQKYQGQCNQNQVNSVSLKVPTNREETAFHTIQQPLWIFPPMIGVMSQQQMANGYFQQKMTWLRFQVQKLRVTWEHGCEVILVDRHNVLMSSIQQMQKMNLRKEIKIKFDNQEVDDAGGVMREWMNLACKEIFNFEMSGLFKLCNADETAYRFVLDADQTQDQKHFKMIIARLLGMIIGKAIFQRVSLNCFLTKSLWRQICGMKVRQGDFSYYDRDIYKNLMFIRENKIDTDFGVNFTYMIPLDGKEQGKQVKLKENGENIMVNDKNKKEFITNVINQFCTKSCSHYIDAIKQGIENVIPMKLLQIFEPFQMENLLNGPQHINLQEWKASTQYKEYKANDKQVQWFWKYMATLNQQKLGNLLHYVTGSRRVPILGFFFLESNRNEIRRFTIEKAEYTKSNPYPKGHTCFNRLQLPFYQSQQQLKLRMDIILKDEINSFGLS